MPFDWTQLDFAQLGAWVVVAIAAVAILAAILYAVSKVVSASLRIAIILGSLIVIALALFVLSMLITQGSIPGL